MNPSCSVLLQPLSRKEVLSCSIHAFSPICHPKPRSRRCLLRRQLLVHLCFKKSDLSNFNNFLPYMSVICIAECMCLEKFQDSTRLPRSPPRWATGLKQSPKQRQKNNHFEAKGPRRTKMDQERCKSEAETEPF